MACSRDIVQLWLALQLEVARRAIPMTSFLLSYDRGMRYTRERASVPHGSRHGSARRRVPAWVRQLACFLCSAWAVSRDTSLLKLLRSPSAVLSW
jgi:hypothetical protein